MLIRRNTTTASWSASPRWSGSPGIRWTVEDGFQAAKGQVGLDQHQVRRWNSWHRHSTLAMAALAVLAICAADSREPGDHLTRQTMTRLTVNEIRRLVNLLILEPARDLNLRLHWSGWRRQHQARARRAHWTRHHNHEHHP